MEKSVKELTEALTNRLFELRRILTGEQKTAVAKEQGISIAELYRLCSLDTKKVGKKLEVSEALCMAMEVKAKEKQPANA